METIELTFENERDKRAYEYLLRGVEKRARHRAAVLRRLGCISLAVLGYALALIRFCFVR